MQIETPEILLRNWRESDIVPWQRMCADETVMRYFPCLLTAEEARQQAQIYAADIKARGWGIWVLEIKGTAEFAGFVGLGVPKMRPDWVEIAWRLDAAYWHRGWATKAANAVFAAAFGPLGLREVMAFTAQINAPSERLMQRLCMQRRSDLDFNHPALPAGDRLERHIVYAMNREMWDSRPEKPLVRFI